MKVRIVLPLLALVLTSALVAAGEGMAPATGTGPLWHLRGKACRVGDVRPVLSVWPAEDGDFDRFLFEGVAVAGNGVVYTQEQCTGDVYRIDRHGVASVIATIDYGTSNDYYCSQAGGLGMAIGPDGDLWVAVISWVPESHGVWRVGRDGSAELAVPMSFEDVPVPNGLTFDSRGNLYVTESLLGGIWKVEPGGEPTLWLQDDLLLPPGGPWTGFGANGIAYRHHALYVVSTDRGIILRVPIGRDGSPGEPSVFASGLVGPDGVAFDAYGQLFAVTAYGGEVVRIRRGREPEVVVDLRAAGADYPASLDFKRSPQGADTAYITNFVPLDGQPNLVKVNLCQKRPCKGR